MILVECGQESAADQCNPPRHVLRSNSDPRRSGRDAKARLVHRAHSPRHVQTHRSTCPQARNKGWRCRCNRARGLALRAPPRRPACPSHRAGRGGGGAQVTAACTRRSMRVQEEAPVIRGFACWLLAATMDSLLAAAGPSRPQCPAPLGFSMETKDSSCSCIN